MSSDAAKNAYPDSFEVHSFDHVDLRNAYDRGAREERERLAVKLSEPGRLWYGDGGVKMLIDPTTMRCTPLVEWLRSLEPVE